MEEKNHVLVTLATMPNKPERLHVYGPYTRTEARRADRRVLATAREEGYDRYLVTFVRPLIDIEAMNARLNA